MIVTRTSEATVPVRLALRRWLPEAEMAMSLVDTAALVTEVRDDEGAVRAVGVAVETSTTLSGAPVLLAVAADDEHAADLLADASVPLSAAAGGLEVHGPGSTATRVVSTLGRLANATVALVMQQRLLVAESVDVPWDVPGWMRPMLPADHELVATWMDAFSVEALGGAPRGPEHWAEQVAEAGTRMLLWELDGVPVAMLHRRRTTPVSHRIGPVYTPVEHRGRGFAAALTAHATRGALQRGSDRVVLFTDVRNETSHGVYRRVGYVDVGPHTSYVLQRR